MMVLILGATEFSVKTLAKIMFYTGASTNKSPSRWLLMPDSTMSAVVPACQKYSIFNKVIPACQKYLLFIR